MELTSAILRASGARAVVTTRALAPEFSAMRALCPELSLVLSADELDAPALDPDALPSLDDIAFVQFTSGSTSSPKGVALTHANLSENIAGFAGPSGVDASPQDVGISWLPLSHDMGLVGLALGAL
jgi:fatty-acyl-CoA synthase